MAKKRTATRTQVVRVVPSAPAPIVVAARRAPARRRAAPAKRRSPRRRRGGSVAAGLGGFVSQHNLDGFLGGAMFGYAVKEGWVDKLPAVPVIGRTGTAALALDYFSKRGFPFLRKAAIAAAVLAGYQLGHDGKVTGDEQTADGFSTTGDEE